MANHLDRDNLSTRDKSDFPISEVLLYYKPLAEQRNVLHFLPAQKIMELFLVVSEGKSRCDIFQAENLLYSIQKCAFYCS